MNTPQRRPASGLLWLTLVVVLLLFRVITFLPDEVNSFAASHYLFSYANGFHKRALVGAVLGHFVGPLTGARIYAMSLWVLAGFTAGLLLVMRRALLASRDALVLGVALLGAPAILPHFAYSIGYFDPLLVICALLAAAALDTPAVGWLRALLAFVPCAVGVLIHESYVFAAFPLVLARGWLSGRTRKSTLWTLAAMVFLLTLVVQMFGQPSVSVDTYTAQAAARTNSPVNREAFELLYFHLQENLSYLLAHYSSAMTDARLLAALIVPIPYFVLLYDLFGLTTRAVTVDAGTRRMVGVCTLAPLLLILVGFDALRWVSCACLVCSLVVFECIRIDRSGEVLEVVTRYVRSARFIVLALFSFTLGPFHVVDGNAVATGIHSIARGLGLVRW
jgi:hypothetical protein